MSRQSIAPGRSERRRRATEGASARGAPRLRDGAPPVDIRRAGLEPASLYAITYERMPVGPRVKALREAMGLSLRDLAERSGVSAPMLSQVERGETSPTLAVASRIAAGLELRLVQLLRLDEAGAVTIVRAGERRRGGRAGRPPLRGPHPAAARPARRALAATCSRPARATGGPGDPPMHEPGSREIAVVEAGTVVLDIDGERHELASRRLRDLRRRPAPPLREPRPRRGGAAGRRLRRAAEELSPPCPSTLFDKIWDAHEVAPEPALHRPAPRPRGHEPAGLRRPAPRRPRACAGPTARWPRPTTTCPPTARRSRRASATSSAACRSRRSSATARSSASRSTRWAPSTRASSTSSAPSSASPSRA